VAPGQFQPPSSLGEVEDEGGEERVREERERMDGQMNKEQKEPSAQKIGYCSKERRLPLV